MRRSVRPVRLHLLPALLLAGLLALVQLAVFGTSSSQAVQTVLVGDQVVRSNVDSNPAGMAEAFQYTATASGSATRLVVYVDGGSTASQVVVGLYADAGNTPGALLAQGTIAAPVKGAWNTVTVPAAAVTAGTSYWIAVLGPTGAGSFQFRDVPTGGRAQVSAQSNLAALPATWSSGATYFNSPMSAYAAP